MNGRPSNANDPLLLPWNHPAGLGQTLCLRHGHPGLSTIPLRRVGSLRGSDTGLAVGYRLRRGIPRLVDGLDLPLVDYTMENIWCRPTSVPITRAADAGVRKSGVQQTPLIHSLRPQARVSEWTGIENRPFRRFTTVGLHTLEADVGPEAATMGRPSGALSDDLGVRARAGMGRKGGIQSGCIWPANSAVASASTNNPVAPGFHFTGFASDAFSGEASFDTSSRSRRVLSPSRALSVRAVAAVARRVEGSEGRTGASPMLRIDPESLRVDPTWGLEVDSTPCDDIHRKAGIPAIDGRIRVNSSALVTVRPRSLAAVTPAPDHDATRPSRSPVVDANSVASTALGSDWLDRASRTGPGAPHRRRADPSWLSIPTAIMGIVIPPDASATAKCNPSISFGSDALGRESDRRRGGLSWTVPRLDHAPIGTQIGSPADLPIMAFAVSHRSSAMPVGPGLSPCVSWPGAAVTSAQNPDVWHQHLARQVGFSSRSPVSGNGSDGASSRELSEVPAARRAGHTDVPPSSGGPGQWRESILAAPLLHRIYSPEGRAAQSALQNGTHMAVRGRAEATFGSSLRIDTARRSVMTGTLRGSDRPDQTNRAAIHTGICRFDPTSARPMHSADPAYPFSWSGLSHVRCSSGARRAVVRNSAGPREQSGRTAPPDLPVTPGGAAAGDASPGRFAVGAAVAEPLVSWNNRTSALHPKAWPGMPGCLGLRPCAGTDKARDNGRLVVVPAAQVPMSAARQAANVADTSGADVCCAAVPHPVQGGIFPGRAGSKASHGSVLESAPIVRPLSRRGDTMLRSVSNGRQPKGVETTILSSPGADMPVAVRHDKGTMTAIAPAAAEYDTPRANLHPIRQWQPCNSVPGSAPIGADAVSAGLADIDELLDKLWFRLLRRLTLEKERRGWTRWN